MLDSKSIYINLDCDIIEMAMNFILIFSVFHLIFSVDGGKLREFIFLKVIDSNRTLNYYSFIKINWINVINSLTFMVKYSNKDH